MGHLRWGHSWKGLFTLSGQRLEKTTEWRTPQNQTGEMGQRAEHSLHKHDVAVYTCHSSPPTVCWVAEPGRHPEACVNAAENKRACLKHGREPELRAEVQF